jgi:hypothetical protein
MLGQIEAPSPTRGETEAASPGMIPVGKPWAGRSAMPNGKYPAILRRGEIKAWHAGGPERRPRAAGQAVVEDALEGRPCSSGEAVTTSPLETAVPRVETKRGLGYRLLVGGAP